MSLTISAALDDTLLAQHYERHWLDLGMRTAEAAPDWREQFRAFVGHARQHRRFAAFVAHLDGTPALGSACCQVVDRVYPAFTAADRGDTGYLWGVYVEPAARGHGIGQALVLACIAHLRAQGCGRVLLHTGAKARPLYERLGFTGTDELALRLTEADLSTPLSTQPTIGSGQPTTSRGAGADNRG